MAPWVNTMLGNMCAITGTYRKLGPDHAGRYLASFAWRYNRRYHPRFVAATSVLIAGNFLFCRRFWT